MNRRPMLPAWFVGFMGILALTSFAGVSSYAAGASTYNAGAPAEAPTSLSGVVTNSFGAALDHALVLLTPVPPSSAVRTATTGKDGRYSFAGLPGSTYRVTAIKDGYETTIGQISTWVHRSLDMILVPVGEPHDIPSSANWILTAPKRDILRDVDGSGAIPARYDASTRRHTGSSVLDVIDGEILQSFTEANGGLSEDSSVTGGNGSTTSLAVGSPLGGRLRWNLLGERAREVTSWRDARVQGLESNAQRLRVGLRYDTGELGRLDMRAFYDHDSLLYEPTLSAQLDPFDSGLERKAWGYDADWIGTVGRDANVQLDLRYLGSAVAGSGSSGSRREATNPDDLPDEIDAQTNIWKTTARISKRVGNDHQLHVGVKARVSSFGGAKGTRIPPSQIGDPSLLADLGRDGWTVSVNAGESWKVLEPISLDFGFDVSRSMDSSRQLREAVIPQAGVTFTPNASTNLRGVVSYVAIDRNEDPALDGLERGSRRASDTVGLRLRAEQALGTAVTLVLDAASQPFSYESIGARWGASDRTGDRTVSGTGLFLSDDAASLREINLAVEARPSRRTVLTFGSSGGTVKGQVAAALPEHDFAEVLADRTLRYVVVHLGGRFEATGTDVRLDLTRLDQTENAAEESLYSDRRIDLRMLQALRFMNVANTDWSLVLACSSYMPLNGASQRATATSPALRAGITRLSGGVAVRF